MHHLGLIRRFSQVAALASALIAGGAAQANLVNNGGFETGTFAGWSQFGDTSNSGISTTAPNSGVYKALFNPMLEGGIEQVLPTVPGTTYDVEFWLRIDGTPGSTNSFEFNWDGGSPEWTLKDVNPGYGTFHYVLNASSASTDLRFAFSGGRTLWSLDDVSVTPRAGSVPEPATAPLALAALLTLGLLRAGRRR